GAEDWQLFRHEGRDSVALENIAKIYSFPPPPALRIQAGHLAVFEPSSDPVAAPAEPAEPDPPPTTPDGTPPTPAPQPGSQSVTLDNGKHQLGLSINSRVAHVNGVKQWLSFATHIQEGKLLISRLDLVKNIEPQFRPEKIQGLKPVR